MPHIESSPQAPIRGHIENGSQWKHKDLARELYQVADVMSFYFFSPRTPADIELPKPIIEIEPARVETLAWYRLDHSGIGLKWHIGLNERHLNRPKWSLYESVTHELVHLYQESMVEAQVDGFKSCRGGYHNKQFVDLAEEIGLHPKLGEGYHLRPADGQFAKLMDRYAVAPVPPKKDSTEEPPENWWSWWGGAGGSAKTKGASTLVLYTAAECVRKPQCKIRSGRADLHIGCVDCGGLFQAQK